MAEIDTGDPLKSLIPKSKHAVEAPVDSHVNHYCYGLEFIVGKQKQWCPSGALNNETLILQVLWL